MSLTSLLFYMMTWWERFLLGSQGRSNRLLFPHLSENKLEWWKSGEGFIHWHRLCRIRLMLLQSTSGSAAGPEQCQVLAVKPLCPPPQPPSLGSRGSHHHRAEAMKVRKGGFGCSLQWNWISVTKVTKKHKENGEEFLCWKVNDYSP